MTANTEGLARRAANDDICFRKFSFGRQCNLVASAFQIPPICFACIGIFLIPNCLKALRLEPQSKTATTRKQIQCRDFSGQIGMKQRLYSLDILHLLVNIQNTPSDLAANADQCKNGKSTIRKESQCHTFPRN